MLVLIIGLERFWPRSPAPLVAVVVGIIGSGLLGLERAGVEIVGAIQPGLPSFAMPDFSLIKLLWPGALGIALMSFVETIAAGRTFTRHGEPRPKANQELAAIGVANFVGSFFHTMPAGGGTSQTAVNRSANCRTQIAGLVAAIIGIAVLLVLAPVFRVMPLATLAAVVIATSIPLISPKEFRSIRRIRHIEFRWAFVALLGVVLLGTLQGIFIAVVLSLLSILYHANHPPVYALGRKPGTDVFRPLSAKHPDDEKFPGLLIVRTEGRMHFANAQRVGDKVWPLIHEAKPKVLVLDLDAVPDIEYTALKMLIEMEEKLREKGITLWLAALNPEVSRVIDRSGFGRILGKERISHNVEEAVKTYIAKFKS
jgi:anti-anti-sigma factor